MCSLEGCCKLLIRRKKWKCLFDQLYDSSVPPNSIIEAGSTPRAPLPGGHGCHTLFAYNGWLGVSRQLKSSFLICASGSRNQRPCPMDCCWGKVCLLRFSTVWDRYPPRCQARLHTNSNRRIGVPISLKTFKTKRDQATEGRSKIIQSMFRVESIAHT